MKNALISGVISGFCVGVSVLIYWLFNVDFTILTPPEKIWFQLWTMAWVAGWGCLLSSKGPE